MTILLTLALLLAPPAPSRHSNRPPAKDIAVPASCTPDVNAQLAQLIHSHPTPQVLNVMVCGTSTGAYFVPRAGSTGLHHHIPITMTAPDGTTYTVVVVANDSLDHLAPSVAFPAGATVFAYGRVYFDDPSYQAGLDEVHCSTNAQANNGWFVVNGTKYPASCAGH